MVNRQENGVSNNVEITPHLDALRARFSKLSFRHHPNYESIQRVTWVSNEPINGFEGRYVFSAFPQQEPEKGYELQEPRKKISPSINLIRYLDFRETILDPEDKEASLLGDPDLLLHYSINVNDRFITVLGGRNILNIIKVASEMAKMKLPELELELERLVEMVDDKDHIILKENSRESRRFIERLLEELDTSKISCVGVDEINPIEYPLQ